MRLGDQTELIARTIMRHRWTSAGCLSCSWMSSSDAPTAWAVHQAQEIVMALAEAAEREGTL